jgi:hypothetical protein
MARRFRPKGCQWLGRPKVGEDPRLDRLGPERTASWASVENFPRKMKTGCRRCLGQNANWASEWISELISRILSSKQKV